MCVPFHYLQGTPSRAFTAWSTYIVLKEHEKVLERGGGDSRCARARA